ncbi:MAG: 4-hydroxy-tetrahydrodipicolinate reductase [Planctomycetota bacterium]
MRQPANIILVGASGTVGSRIDALAREDGGYEVIARIDTARPHSTLRELAPKKCEILVDFSHSNAMDASIEVARQRKAALLAGTTGLHDTHLRALEELARSVPVLVAPNTAVGCVVLLEMVPKISRALGKNFSPSIVEWHRQGKVDAPSGTARAFMIELENAADRGSALGSRAVASVRAGGIFGEHLIRFDGPDETIELVHKAHSRDLFARGALRAASWLVNQEPGSFTMADVLGLRDESPSR